MGGTLEILAALSTLREAGRLGAGPVGGTTEGPRLLVDVMNDLRQLGQQGTQLGLVRGKGTFITLSPREEKTGPLQKRWLLRTALIGWTRRRPGSTVV